jgi:uncharacterized protein (DUF302 family)
VFVNLRIVPKPSQPDDGIVTKPSPGSVDETVRRLTRLIEEKGLKLFTVIDHSGEARQAGLQMLDTKLVIFGSPSAGTPIMVAEPLAAIDLPLKVLVWADSEGVTRVSFNSPGYIVGRHHLAAGLQAPLEGIGPIVDATVSSGE